MGNDDRDDSAPQASPPDRPPRRISKWLGYAVLLVAIIGVGRYAAVRFWDVLSKPAPENLNVLLITLDTTRADFLRCYGRGSARTPHLDQLAREGTIFASCSSSSALTLPSHSSIMTGTYPFVHGARDNGNDRLAAGNVTLAEALKEQGFTTQAIIASFVLNHQFGIDQGFDEYSDVDVADDPDPIHAERKGDEICEEALEALRTLAPNRFFLWVHFYDPHYPYVPTRAQSFGMVDAYEDEIAFMDARIGQLLDELEHLGIDNNTLVVVLGDHGEALTQHGEMFHGDFVYDSTLRVPLIFRCPRIIPPRRVIGTQVRTIDVAPTILDLVAAAPLEVCQGVSLTPLISGEADNLDLAAYGESLAAYRQFRLSPLRSLSREGWKYVLAPKPELYHVLTDPGELHNKVAEQPELAGEMREELRALIAEAPPPPSDEESTITLSPTEVALLESLGYAGGTKPARDDGDMTELDMFEPRGGDPKDHVEAMRANMMAVWLLREKDFVRAEELLREVVDSIPNAIRPLGNLAYAVHRQERFDEATELYDRALALVPDDHAVQKRYAELFVDSEQWEEAVRRFRVVLTNRPHDLISLYNMGKSLGSLGRFDEAHQHFELALQIAPRSVRMHRGLGVLYARQKKFEQAINWFRKGLEIDPTDLKLQKNLQRAIQLKNQP